MLNHIICFDLPTLGLIQILFHFHLFIEIDLVPWGAYSRRGGVIVKTELHREGLFEGRLNRGEGAKSRIYGIYSKPEI